MSEIYESEHPPYPPGAMPEPRKRRRVFMWVFLAVQAVFLALLVLQLQGHTGPTQSDLASGCYHHAWWPLFKSQADCVTHYGGALNGAGELGKGIGAVLIIGVWVALDVILGVGRLVVVFSRRPKVT